MGCPIKLRKFSEAIMMYDNAPKINPNNYNVYFNKGIDFLITLQIHLIF